MLNIKSKNLNEKKPKIKKSNGYLYIVPTPIGNLSDITQRALTVLKHVDLIAAEDMRYTGLLLQRFSINARLFGLHAYNEQKKSKKLLEELRKNKNIALVSDAGTPVISDPGYRLVYMCHKAGIKVIPLPGPCAAITALSAAGLPCNRFCYEGFLPSKYKRRRNLLESMKTEERTIIFYESTHRLIESLNDMIIVLGFSRYVVLARELTKAWETIYGAPVGNLLTWVKENKDRRKGEIVLIVEGYKEEKNELSTDAMRIITLLKAELPLKTAVAITAKICNARKNTLYKYMLRKNNNKL